MLLIEISVFSPGMGKKCILEIVVDQSPFRGCQRSSTEAGGVCTGSLTLISVIDVGLWCLML